MEIKNYYGMKKGSDEIVAIVDLSNTQRGLKCGCVCPVCHADFLAKMGEIRAAHFAHSGKSCDAEKANMTGLFMMIRDYLMSGGQICYPAAKWKYDLTFGDAAIPISFQSFDERVTLDSDGNTPKDCRFDSVNIVQNKNEYPIALLCQKGDYTLALRVVPPATICKTPTRTAYDCLPTLLLDLSEKSFDYLSQKNISSILRDPTLFRWLQYVPITLSIRKQLIKKSEAECCKLREQQKRKLAELKNEPTYKKTLSPPLASSCVPFKPRSSVIRMKRQDMTFDRMVNESRIVLDASTGERVGICLICHMPKTKDAFAELPVDYKVENLGICLMCAEKTTKG